MLKITVEETTFFAVALRIDTTAIEQLENFFILSHLTETTRGE